MLMLDEITAKQTEPTSQSSEQLAPHQAKTSNADAATPDSFAATREKLRGSKGRDINHALALMQDGVLIELYVKRPSFTARLTPKDLGIELSSEEAALLDNFRLGQVKLLPREVFNRLDSAEQSSRKCLYRYSWEFGRSRFVPANWFEKWQQSNAEYAEQFQAVAESVIAEYETLVAELLEGYRAVANRNWLDGFRRKLGTAAETKSLNKKEVAAPKAATCGCAS